MKKHLFFVTVALAALTACSNDEVVDTIDNHPDPIEFTAFVDNATRAVKNDITSANITEFYVYAFANSPTYKLFDKERVARVTTGSNTAWTTSGTKQYWTKDWKYWFTALAPCTDSYYLKFPDPVTETTGSTDEIYTGGGTIYFNNTAAEATVGGYTLAPANGQHDLIYAFNRNHRNGKNVEELVNGTHVGFIFYHLLSRVKFVFNSTFSEDTYVNIVNLQITDARSYGSITPMDETYAWQYEGGTFPLAYDDIHFTGTSTNEEAAKTSANTTGEDIRYLIPGQKVFTISFDICASVGGPVSLDAEGNVTGTGDISVGQTVTNADGTEDLKFAHKTIAVTINDHDTDPDFGIGRGRSYNLTATIDGPTITEDVTEILFTVRSVDVWGAERTESLNINGSGSGSDSGSGTGTEG